MNDISNESLVGPADPSPFEILNGDSLSRVILSCDHAGRAVPRNLARLGVDDADFDRHIAYDIGAEALTRAIASRTGWPTILANYSRLVIDPNRRLGTPTSIVEVADGTRVSGNIGLTERQRRDRERYIFHPYHSAFHQLIDAHTGAGLAPAVVALHTFTPALSDDPHRDPLREPHRDPHGYPHGHPHGQSQGDPRPWHVAVLWCDDWRLPRPLIAALEAEPGLVVGDNQPYSAREGFGYTMQRHADAHGLANVTLEVRQDQVETELDVERWADRLTRVLNDVFADESLFTVFDGHGR
jgi:predicted N-formylglutamate amidohydrolase